MRLDIFLSKVGVIKRRIIAKEMADNGMIKVNNRRAKPSREIETGDIIKIGGNRPAVVEVTALPSGSVKKENREKYFRLFEA
jgi:ribosomal 50S subunit-recycling heat shock protein